MRSFLQFLVCLVLASSFVLAAPGQSKKKPPLTNQDIVEMTKAKFTDSTIVKAIEANTTSFDVSASALISLKNSGVSQTVIEAMLSAESPKSDNSSLHGSAAPEKKSSEQGTSRKIGREISVYADDWTPAELKECITYANEPFALSCDEHKTEWPNSLFKMRFDLVVDQGFSDSDAFRKAILYEKTHSKSFEVTFSGNQAAQHLWHVDDPWPDPQAVDLAVKRFGQFVKDEQNGQRSISQMDLPGKETIWKCSKDSSGIACDFRGTDDPILRRPQPSQ